MSEKTDSLNHQPKSSMVPDPFDNLDALRLSQDFAKAASVKAVITTVACRKPTRHEFVRVRPGEHWRFQTATLTDKQERETYLVAPHLLGLLPGECQPTVLYTVIGRRSPIPFLWPCFMPGPDGRSNRWHESAHESARVAEAQWVRVVADMDAGCYVPHAAQGDLPEPQWPEDVDLKQLIKLAFKDRFIQSFDHPLLQRLRGEV